MPLICPACLSGAAVALRYSRQQRRSFRANGLGLFSPAHRAGFEAGTRPAPQRGATTGVAIHRTARSRTPLGRKWMCRSGNPARWAGLNNPRPLARKDTRAPAPCDTSLFVLQLRRNDTRRL
jgi:hypothetical protein